MDLIKGSSADNPLYVRNCWYVAGWDYEIKPGELFAITIINEPLVLYRKQDGNLTALSDQCCHRLAPLSLGRLEGEDLRCMYHGLKFNPEGRCIDIPGQGQIGAQFRIRTYPVVEKHSWVWVWMGDPVRADESLIPPAVGLDNPEYTLKAGYIDYEANYLLINDNLTDLSHIAYSHEKTFGAYSDAAARIPPKVKPIDRGIRIHRWNPDQPARDYVSDPGVTTLDQYMVYDYLVPGIFLMFSALYHGGTAARCEQGQPDTDPVHASFTSQAVTPMTDDTSRYFFSWGPRTVEHERDPRIIEGMWRLAQKAFEEDRQVIQAQQRSIRRKPDTPINSIIHDRGPTQMRRIIDNLIREETPVNSGTRM